jgi:histidinol-phosphate aminotransferase
MAQPTLQGRFALPAPTGTGRFSGGLNAADYVKLRIVMIPVQGVPDLGPGLRLHLNENTAGCSPKVVAAVRAFDGPRLATYPDFRDAILETAAFLGVQPDHLVLTNGLDEGILLTAIAYLGARTPDSLVALGAPLTTTTGAAEVLVAKPAFEPYLSTAHAMGARVVSVPATPDYSYPLAAVLDAITPNTRIVYVNNPNNPTGQPVPLDAIRAVARTAGHALVFVDEAYHDFLGENFLGEAREYPNVLVGRTFSKAYGLAGMRVGALVAAPAVLAPIRRAMPLFNLNVVAIAALRAALTDPGFRAEYLRQAAVSKELLYAACDRLGLRYWKSAANFVLVDGGAQARAIVDTMIARGVLVRDRTKDPSSPNCFRVTTGVVAHTEKAVQALEDACAVL